MPAILVRASARPAPFAHWRARAANENLRRGLHPATLPAARPCAQKSSAWRRLAESTQYTPVAGQNGTLHVTVTVTDDGGTANGGVNTTSQTFVVTVQGNKRCQEPIV